MKTMRKHGITVTHRDDGTWMVSTKIGGERYEIIEKTFRGAGSEAFELANNNDEGREINERMCEVFGRLFFYD